MKRITIITLAVTGLATLLALPLSSQPVDLATNEVLQLWLASNCGVGDSRPLTDLLIAVGTELEEPLIQAYAEGPGREARYEVEQDAVESYRKRQDLLASQVDLGLSRDDLAVARDETQRRFVNRQVEAFNVRYRSQALAGLGFVGGRRSEVLLRSLADDADSSYQATARQALETLLGRQPDGPAAN